MTPQTQTETRYAVGLYLTCLSIGNGPLRLLVAITEADLKGRRFHPSVDSLARHMHKSESTIKRWSRELRRRGWIRAERRSKRECNHYALTRAFRGRVTLQRRSPKPQWLEDLESRRLLPTNGQVRDNRDGRRARA